MTTCTVGDSNFRASCGAQEEGRKREGRGRRRGGGGGGTLGISDQGRLWLMAEGKTRVVHTGARMKSWEMNIHRGRQPGRTIKKKGMGSRDREVTSREGCEAGLPGSS